MVDWNLRVLKLEKTRQIEDSHYLTKIKFTHFWDASMTFPLTEGLEYPEFKGLDHRGIGTSQLSQLYLHTCRKMLSTRLTGSSSHLRFTLDHEKVLHSKQRESSPRRQRERDLNTQFGTKMATRPNSWNLSLDSELIKTAQKSRATTGVPTGVSCSPRRVSPWSDHPSFA